MLNIIHKGNKTTCSGSVLIRSEKMKLGVVGIVRKGDRISCSISGHNAIAIVEGNPDYLDNGISVVFHGHKRSCDDTLISLFSAAKVG